MNDPTTPAVPESLLTVVRENVRRGLDASNLPPEQLAVLAELAEIVFRYAEQDLNAEQLVAAAEPSLERLGFTGERRKDAAGWLRWCARGLQTHLEAIADAIAPLPKGRTVGEALALLEGRMDRPLTEAEILDYAARMEQDARHMLANASELVALARQRAGQPRMAEYVVTANEGDALEAFPARWQAFISRLGGFVIDAAGELELDLEGLHLQVAVPSGERTCLHWDHPANSTARH